MDWARLLPTTPGDKYELAMAYTRVFRLGSSSKEDREVVFNDIMSFSGFFNVTPKGSGNLEHENGARSVGGMIFSMTNMPTEERDALYQASRLTGIEGQI